MNTDALQRAYTDFLDSARHAHFATPPASGWSAEMVLAHVIVGDRLIAEAAAHVAYGAPTVFDNFASQSEPYLQSVVEASGGWDALLAAVKRGGDELIGLASQLTDEQAATPVPSRVVSDGAVVFDTPVPLSQLLQVPAAVHLRMHTEQLTALAGEAVHAHASAP